MDFKEIVKSRHAARKFDGKKISEDKLNELLELIRLAPSSFNIQPWKIKIVTDSGLKEKIQSVAWNQPQITTCSHLLIFCADSNITPLIDKLEKNMGPGATSYIQMMRDFEKRLSPEQKVTWAQKQCYIALENALLGAKSLGLDSCPMEGFSPQDVAAILKLPAHLTPTVLCPIGYASDKPTQKFRFSVKDILI